MLRFFKRKEVIAMAWTLVALALLRWGWQFFEFKSRHKPPQRLFENVGPDSPVELKMQKFAEDAALSARMSGVSFDYSVSSLTNVDLALDALARVRAANKIGSTDFEAWCLFWGAYVGEVIRRHHGGGKWAEGEDGTGHGTYPLTVADKMLYPCRWCVERIQSGAPEGVWKNYQVFALEEAVRGINLSKNTNSPAGSN
jgi:hypothetical protein